VLNVSEGSPKTKRELTSRRKQLPFWQTFCHVNCGNRLLVYYLAFLQVLQVLTTFASTGAGAGLCEQALRVIAAKATARIMCFIEGRGFPLFPQEFKIRFKKNLDDGVF